MPRRLVVEQARLDTARAGTAMLGTKLPEVPGSLSALNGPEDLMVLLRRPLMSPEFSGVVIPLYAVGAVMKQARTTELPIRLVWEGEKWSDLKRRVSVFVDPVSEIFYITRPSLRNRIARYPGAPSAFFSKMFRATTDSHASTWSRALNDGSYVVALNWLANLEMEAGVEVVLPLTPFVDGRSMATVSLAIRANSLACDYFSATDTLFGLYFSVNYTAFRKDELVSQLLAGIRKLVAEKAPYIIAIRIRGLPLAERDDDEPLWTTLRGFLVAVGGIASEFGVPFLMLNAGTYGYAALSDGVDFFSEPLNGNLGDPGEEDPITGRRKFNPRWLAGKAYHPELMINLSRQDFDQTGVVDGGLPDVPGSTAPALGISDVDFRKQAKHYRVAARCEEARKFKASIYGAEPRALAEEFARGRARNAEKLLQNPL